MSAGVCDPHLMSDRQVHLMTCECVCVPLYRLYSLKVLHGLLVSLILNVLVAASWSFKPSSGVPVMILLVPV